MITDPPTPYPTNLSPPPSNPPLVLPILSPPPLPSPPPTPPPPPHTQDRVCRSGNIEDKMKDTKYQEKD